MKAFTDIHRELRIASDPAAITSVERFLQAFVEEAGLNEDQAGDVLIAGTEAVNNAILHGNRSQPELEVLIRVECRDKRLRMEISDQGGGFNPADNPDPTSPEQLMEDSGRGLLIIRHFMDELSFIDHPEGQTAVLIKNLHE